MHGSTTCPACAASESTDDTTPAVEWHPDSMYPQAISLARVGSIDLVVRRRSEHAYEWSTRYSGEWSRVETCERAVTIDAARAAAIAAVPCVLAAVAAVAALQTDTRTMRVTQAPAYEMLPPGAPAQPSALVAEARELLARSTPGEWYVWAQQPEVQIRRADNDNVIAEVTTWAGHGSGCFDADLAVEAHNRLLPDLCSAVERLERAVAAGREGVGARAEPAIPIPGQTSSGAADEAERSARAPDTMSSARAVADARRQAAGIADAGTAALVVRLADEVDRLAGWVRVMDGQAGGLASGMLDLQEDVRRLAHAAGFVAWSSTEEVAAEIRSCREHLKAARAALTAADHAPEDGETDADGTPPGAPAPRVCECWLCGGRTQGERPCPVCGCARQPGPEE
jgi:hypothetical protein